MNLRQHIGLGQELRLELKTEQRLELELALEQKLTQQTKLEVTLAQYLAQEDVIKGLIRWTDENKQWVTFDRGGFNFTYGLVPYKLAQPIADKYGGGFAHCVYEQFDALVNGREVALARGDWMLFVVEDMIPREFRDFTALHERGEELSLGNHYFASQLEFAHVAKKRKVRDYNRFIDEECPSKFVDLTEEVSHPVLPVELVEFLKEEENVNEQELATAEALIEAYPLSSSVLRYMKKYDDVTQKVCERIRSAVGVMQGAAYKLSDTGSVDAVADALHRGLQLVLHIDPQLARVVSPVRADTEMSELRKTVTRGLYDRLQRHIVIPTSFSEAYQRAQKGERLATVMRTVEDRHRDHSTRGYALAGR
jgi:hypothetical protein